ncbi:sensor histidine kinase, partial [Synechocystis salina LEGE 06155]|nr:sensor histidine kinase [Synechocystis salina LEGE 06155]
AAHGNGLGDSSLIDLDCQLDPIYLNLETATPCGLIVNELILNVLDHAFTSSESGQVTLEFRDQGENGYLLVVQDNGRGLPQDFDPQTLNTLGWQLITLLTQQLDGQIAIVPTEGTRVELYFRELIYPARL